MGIFTISNILSLSRIPISFLLLPQIMWVRVMALVLAGLSDYFDGFIARRTGTVTRFGAMLDPLMDKFFLFFALVVFGSEGILNGWEITALLARDIFLAIFALYILVSRQWKASHFRSMIMGKVTTVAQYAVLFCIVIGLAIPALVYGAFALLGALFFVELFLAHRQAI